MKRGRAINGDLFELHHPSSTFTAPFTSFIDVAYRGLTHQAFVAADRHAFSYANATGTFTVDGFTGHLVESLDTVETQVTHRYQAIVDTPHGVLSVHSYRGATEVLELVGALAPTADELGVALVLQDDATFASPAKVGLTTEFGVLEVTPLTAEVLDELPTWSGTPVVGGELFGGRFVDGSPYLTLVTDSCRVMLLPGADTLDDDAARWLATLQAHWK